MIVAVHVGLQTQKINVAKRVRQAIIDRAPDKVSLAVCDVHGKSSKGDLHVFVIFEPVSHSSVPSFVKGIGNIEDVRSTQTLIFWN